MKRKFNKFHLSYFFIVIYSIMTSITTVYQSIENDALRQYIKSMDIDYNWLCFQYDFIQFITDICIFIFILCIVVIIDTRKGAKNGTASKR